MIVRCAARPLASAWHGDGGAIDDGALLALARRGDVEAFGELYRRHRPPALRLAVSLAGPSRAEDAEDLVAEAFTLVLGLIARRQGPRVAFRPYLLATLRTLHLNALRAARREHLVDDYTAAGAEIAWTDDVDSRCERSWILRAMSSLPWRWRYVLWLTAVEGRSHEEVGCLLGITPNAVAALSHRARGGLARAYLTAHLTDASDATCRETRAAVAAALRGSPGQRKRTRAEAHLAGCGACRAASVELSTANSGLRSVSGAWRS